MKLPASHGRLGLLLGCTSTWYTIASDGEPQNTKDTNARRGVRRMRMRCDTERLFSVPRGVAVVTLEFTLDTPKKDDMVAMIPTLCATIALLECTRSNMMTSM